MGARLEKGCLERAISPNIIFLAKGLSNEDVRVASVTAYQDIRPGADFKASDFVTIRVWGGGGGGIVERLELAQLEFEGSQ